MAVGEEWDWIERTSKAFDPIDLFHMRDAVLQHRNSFVTENNQTFLLTYMKDGETVKFQPVNGFVPMGFVSIKELSREDTT